MTFLPEDKLRFLHSHLLSSVTHLHDIYTETTVLAFSSCSIISGRTRQITSIVEVGTPFEPSTLQDAPPLHLPDGGQLWFRYSTMPVWHPISLSPGAPLASPSAKPSGSDI